MKEIVKQLLKKLGFGVVSAQHLDDLLCTELLMQKILEHSAHGALSHGESQAQLKQDIVVLLTTNLKRGGYFVEFGATDGVHLSNTYLLEKHYQWNGIVAEPAKVWHERLVQNRDCNIELDCVWHTSGETLAFNSVGDGELSTINTFSAEDKHAKIRESGEVYDVVTISLTDLLLKHKAPKIIDYLSIDTEGSELDILTAFDFTSHSFAIIHVEHNFIDDKRQAIHQLLSKYGYQRRYTNLSEWDDWYFRDDLL